MSQRKPDTVSGVVIINKHEGVTSHRIISILRRMYDTQRVGHTGTLDPMATGVLPVMIGRAVKASDYLMMHDKEYVCEMKLGLTTDTEDITGEVLLRSDEIPTEDEVRAACASFVGKIMQVPPMYSAVKVGGRKLIDIAREGGEVEREAREVTVHSMDVTKLSDDTYSIRVECSKGTYIRTLCNDIGKKLGCGAVMSKLTRTRTGSFTLDEAYTIEQLEQMTFKERLALARPVESLFLELRAVEIPDFFAKLIVAGCPLFQKKLRVSIPEGELVRVRNRGRFLALARAEVRDGVNVIVPEKLFVLDNQL